MFKNLVDVIEQELDNKIQFAKKKTLTRVIKMDAPFQCQTMEGVVEGKAGDYLAIGAAGEVYPIDAGIFEMTYDIVELKEPDES